MIRTCVCVSMFSVHLYRVRKLIDSETLFFDTEANILMIKMIIVQKKFNCVSDRQFYLIFTCEETFPMKSHG